MPTISNLAFTTLARLPDREEGKVAFFEHAMVIPASGVNNADDVTVVTMPAGFRILEAYLTVSATLGASATVQLRQGSTALTPATTAGGASTVSINRRPITTNGTDALNLLVGGANVTASATATVSITYIRA